MLELVKNRRSVRKYTRQPVEEEKINLMLEGARWAPSGNNLQPWQFIVVRSAEQRQKLSQVAHQQAWMISAPVFIVCVADPTSRLGHENHPVIDETSPLHEVKQVIRDTAIATEHLVLEAENQGLGTCWVAWFLQEEIRQALQIPADKYVVAIITVGYPAVAPSPTPRRKIEELVRYEHW